MAVEARVLLAGAGGRRDQSRPLPPWGFCLDRSSPSWRRRRAQVCRFSCLSSLESRVQRRGRDWRGSLVARGLSSVMGLSLLGFSFFSFSPFLGFSFCSLSWDPRSPRGARFSPEASCSDPSVASDLSCCSAWAPGGPDLGSGGPDGGTESRGLSYGETMWDLGVRAHLPTGPTSSLGEQPHQVKEDLPGTLLASWVEHWAGPTAEGQQPPPPQPLHLKVSQSGLEDTAHPPQSSHSAPELLSWDGWSCSHLLHPPRMVQPAPAAGILQPLPSCVYSVSLPAEWPLSSP